MRTLETIHLLHHSHTDIGFTHDQPILWEMQRRFINTALDCCERDLGHDRDDAFHWTCETFGPVLHWLDHASDRQVERLLRVAKAGRMEFTGQYLHVMPLADAVDVAQMLQPLDRLRRDYHLSITHAMSADVNGHNWTVIDTLLDAGLTTMSMAINEHTGGAPFERPNLFRWQSPAGRTIPVWNGFHYNFGNWLGIGYSLSEFESNLPRLEQMLARAQWPHPFLLLQATAYGFDNTTADHRLPEFVRMWNAGGKAPRLKFTTWREWWKIVAADQDNWPVHKGDWTDFWTFGAVSAPREVARARAARARLRSADLLLSALAGYGVRPGAVPTVPADLPGRDPGVLLAHVPESRARAWAALHLCHEHTWGADCDVAAPESEDAQSQIAHKAHESFMAKSLSQLVLRDAAAELSLLMPRRSGGSVVVFNPLPWSRAVWGRVPRLVAAIKGSGEDPSGSRHAQDRLTHMTGPWLKPVQLPACGYVSVPLAELEDDAAGVESTSAVVETPRLRLEFDLERGGLRAWHDKATGRDLVDADQPWSFGGLVHEEVADRAHSWPRALVMGEVAWSITEHQRGWRGQWPAKRVGATRLLSHRVIRRSAGIEVRQAVEVAGVAVDYSFTVGLHSSSVAFEYEWLDGLDAHPQAKYAAFPFAIPRAVARVDVGLQPMVPGAEQLPGCCHDYFNVQNWTDLSNEEFGVTIASPQNPLIQLGGFNFGRGGRTVRLENAFFLGWIYNNYWEVNFRAYSPGRITGRYFVQPHAGPFDETAAHRFALECATPAVFQSGEEPTRGTPVLPREGSLLGLPAGPVFATHLEPRWGDTANADRLVLRLQNASDQPQLARVESGCVTVLGAEEADFFGNPTGSLAVLGGGVDVSLEPRAGRTLILHVGLRR